MAVHAAKYQYILPVSPAAVTILPYPLVTPPFFAINFYKPAKYCLWIW